MEIPAEILIDGTIEQGAIYYFPEDSITSDAPHYFVVLNIDPKKDTILILACGTSQVKEAFVRRRNLPRETVVGVSTTECKYFKRNTAFDCNSLIQQSLNNLINKKTQGILEYKGKLSEVVLNKLIKGVLASPMVDRKHKKIVNP